MLYVKDGAVIEANRNNVDSCPVCDNKIGFAMGTCVSCGFNYIEADFKFIEVHVDHLPKELKEALVSYHASKYKVKSHDIDYHWD